MLDSMLDAADPFIAEAIFGGIATYCGWLFRYVLRTKQSQESLHRALNTGVDLVTDLLAQGIADNRSVDQVTDYVRRSVPDAVRYLKADNNQLRLMAKAKIRGRLGLELIRKLTD